MTLSNRITLAGALPIVVALALIAVVAAILLAPPTNVSAVINAKGCELSADLQDALLDRFDLAATKCDNLTLVTAGGVDKPDIDVGSATVWDFSDRGWTEFGISAEDAAILKILTDTAEPNADGEGAGPVIEPGVRYIDLTGNDIAVDDVDFARIPDNVAIILDGVTTGTGFQVKEYTVTEGVSGYVSVAFPDLMDDDDTTDGLQFEFVVSGGDSGDNLNAGIDGGDATLTNASLISLGTTADRDAIANSDSDSKVFYYPLNVGKDNTTLEEWDFTVSFDETAADLVGFAGEFDPNILDATVTVLDADAPAVSVCARSADVRDQLEALVAAANADNDDCDEVTSTDLSNLTAPVVISEFGADADDALPIENLIAGDFQGLTKITGLTINGARMLPSGIFEGVGSGLDAGTTVTIQFGKNTTTDPDDEKAGAFTVDTIPSHIWDSQEKQQVIIVDDELDDKDMAVTKGLDASLYAGEEGGHFFVLTPYTTNAWVLGTSIVFGTTPVTAVVDPAPSTPKVVRFAVALAQETGDAADDTDDETQWLFLLNNASPGGNVGDLIDYAVVLISDDD